MIDWFLTDAVTSVVTWVGTILTVGGVLFTFLQSRAARQSANRAESAVSRLKVHIDTANVAYASAQLNTFSQMVRSRHFDVGIAFFDPIKRSLRLQSQADPSHIAEVETVNRAIGTIEKQLNWGLTGDEKYKEVRIFNAIRGLMQTATNWEVALARSEGQERRR